MALVVLLSERASDAIRSRRDTPESEEVRRLTGSRGLDLQLAHPAAGDPKLRRYFRVETEDREAAEALAAALLELEAVEAAYWKPAEALP